MNLQPRKEQIVGQKEFLRNTQGMEFKTGGVTLDAASFTAGEYVKAGTAVFRDTDGLHKPWPATAAGTEEGACLTTHDVLVRAGQNPITGGLSAGHPIESKCTGVTDEFKAEVKGRLVFDI